MGISVHCVVYEGESISRFICHSGAVPRPANHTFPFPDWFSSSSVFINFSLFLRGWISSNNPGCAKGQRRFANRASRRCGGSLPVVLSGAIHLFKPLSPGAKTATTVSASPGVKCTSRKTFCPEAGKNFCGLPPDSRFRPWQ